MYGTVESSHEPRHMPRSARLAGAIAVILATACSMAVPTPTLQSPDQLPSGAGVGPLKAHLNSGELVVFETWEEDVAARQITGAGRRYDLERKGDLALERISLPVDSVALLEVTRDVADAGYGLGLTLLASYTVLTGTVSLICLADPKSCFGSCPTFYVDDDGDVERLVAEGFSSSVAPSLEASDLDDLRVMSGDGPFSLRMRNEALETHAVRSLRLLAVAEPDGRRVYASPDGSFHAPERTLEPTRCTAAEGSCLEAVRARDGVERKSLTDPENLATREIIELDFDRRDEWTTSAEAPRLGLVIAARHSFVSTFLFYQMLAYMGHEAGPFLASLERSETGALERVREVMEMPGRLEVEVMGSDGSWRTAGAMMEAGPLASDVQLLELPALQAHQAQGPIRVRLDLTQGFWRLEHVALVEIGEPAEAIALEPVSLERLHGLGATLDQSVSAERDSAPAEGEAAPEALEALLDPDRFLVTEPGDHFRVGFMLPRKTGDTTGEAPGYRLFLESTGYYYEWMRSEWLEDESPERAAMMFLQPELTFRQLAPAFKKLEPEMEEAFWNSRYRR